jgi:hypothetical protein
MTEPMTILTHIDLDTGDEYIVVVRAKRDEVVAAVETYSGNPALSENDTLETYLEARFQPVPYDHIDVATVKGKLEFLPEPEVVK